MKKSPLWEHGVIVLLVCGVAVFGRTDNAGAPVQATAGHSNMDCSVCHSLVASLDETEVPSSTRSCRSCHGALSGSEDRLAAVFHRNQNRSCGDCHLFHETGMITAVGNVFAPTQSGGSEACAACHNETANTVALSPGHRLAAGLYHSNNPALAGLSASQTCLVCHADEQTVQVDGLELANIPRFSKHRMHPVGRVERHDEFRNGVRSRRSIDPRLSMYDDRIECSTCHQLTSVTKYRLIDLGSPRALCLGCHEFE
jgi:predicted CXXCH cytochrome family protein